MKRIAIAAVALLALVLAGGAVAAGGRPATFSTGFTLTSATCPNLPPGTTVTGTGVGTSIDGGDGVTTVMNTTHEYGTATDQDGNTYVFQYANSFRGSWSGGTFTGLMTDHFSLSGPGPAALDNGFTATFTTDFATFFSFDPISSHGDPIDFATGEELCDPL